MSGLWRNHAATLRQQALSSGTARKKRPTQADVLIAMLRECRSQGTALELPAIMSAGIAQHGARFNEIRAQGFEIENEIDRFHGVVRSRYRLVFDPQRDSR
jgi:hypothetical protein